MTGLFFCRLFLRKDSQEFLIGMTIFSFFPRDITFFLQREKKRLFLVCSNSINRKPPKLTERAALFS